MKPFLAGLALAAILALPGAAETSLQQANAVLFQQLQSVHRLSAAQMQRLGQIFARSAVIGQGNPAISRHPMTPEQCRARIPGGNDGPVLLSLSNNNLTPFPQCQCRKSKSS